MFDFRGRKLLKAKPSTPVQVMGLNDVPEAGEHFPGVPLRKRSQGMVVEERKNQAQQSRLADPQGYPGRIVQTFKAGEVQELRLIVKADVQGSLEPIRNSLNDLNTGEIKINILYAETGNITENDVSLAAASQAIIVGFQRSGRCRRPPHG